MKSGSGSVCFIKMCLHTQSSSTRGNHQPSFERHPQTEREAQHESELAEQFHSMLGDVEPQVSIDRVMHHSWLEKNTKDVIPPLLLEHMEMIFEGCKVSLAWLKSVEASGMSQSSALTEAESSVPPALPPGKLCL